MIIRATEKYRNSNALGKVWSFTKPVGGGGVKKTTLLFFEEETNFREHVESF